MIESNKPYKPSEKTGYESDTMSPRTTRGGWPGKASNVGEPSPGAKRNDRYRRKLGE